MRRTSAFVVSIMVIVALSSCGISQGIKGKVTDKIYGDPVNVVTVTLQNLDDMTLQPITTTVNEKGEYEVSVDPPGRYRVEIEDKRSNFQYVRFVRAVKIEQGKVEQFDVQVDPVVKTYIHGQILAKDTGKPVEGAKIKFDSEEATTGKDGKYIFKYTKPGPRVVTIEAKGYAIYKQSYNLSQGETMEDFKISPSAMADKPIIKNITDLLSYQVEVVVGPNNETVSSSTKMVVNHLPFGLKVTSKNGTGLFYVTDSYIKKGDKFEKVSEEQFKIFRNEYDFFNSLYNKVAQRLSGGKDISTDKEPDIIGEFNAIRNTFKFEDSGKEYNTTMWIVYEGPFLGLPAKIVLERQGEYIEFNFSLFNAIENSINKDLGNP